MGDRLIKSVAEIMEESYQGRRWNPGEGRRKVVELPRGHVLNINVDQDWGWNIEIGGEDTSMLREIVNFLQEEEVK